MCLEKGGSMRARTSSRFVLLVESPAARVNPVVSSLVRVEVGSFLL